MLPSTPSIKISIARAAFIPRLNNVTSDITVKENMQSKSTITTYPDNVD